jgi:hypothetical protein
MDSVVGGADLEPVVGPVEVDDPGAQPHRQVEGGGVGLEESATGSLVG